MPEIVPQRDRFGEVLIQRQCSGNCATDRSDLNRMGQPGPQMIAGPIQENLRLVFQPAERA